MTAPGSPIGVPGDTAHDERVERTGRATRGVDGVRHRYDDMAQHVVVDFAGHGFQFDLSRALARRGHAVTHTWCSSNLTPHGDLRSGDGVTAIPVDSGGAFEKYRLASRLRSEVVYGLRTARLVWRLPPRLRAHEQRAAASRCC